jgi:hypothetical protein
MQGVRTGFKTLLLASVFLGVVNYGAANANLLTNGDFAAGGTNWTEVNSCCYYFGSFGDTTYSSGQGFHEGAISTDGHLQTF